MAFSRSMVDCGSGRFTLRSNGEPGAACASAKVMTATKNIVGMTRSRRRIAYASTSGLASLRYVDVRDPVDPVLEIERRVGHALDPRLLQVFRRGVREVRRGCVLAQQS